MIRLSTITLQSKNGKWFRKAGDRRVECTESDFKVYFKAACIQFEEAQKSFAKTSRPYKSAEKKYNFFLKQINDEQGDYFSLIMYPTIDWRV